MISTRVRFNGSKVKLAGDGPDKYTWFALGQFGIKTIRDRVSRGIGSDDSPMPPLSGRESAITRDGKFVRRQAGYRDRKQRFGGRPIRDLYGKGDQGGHMLDNLTVREATTNSVRMDITSRTGRVKARANERRSPWFGFSPRDRRIVLARMIDVFRDRGRVINIGSRVRGGRSVFARAA